MQNRKPLVVAVVPAFGAEDQVADCVESLVQQTGAHLKVVVVQNGASEGLLDDLSQRYQGITVIRNGANVGASGGRNVGMQWALDHGAEYVFLADNDAVIAPDACQRLIEVVADRADIGFAACVIWRKSDHRKAFDTGGFVDPPLGTRHLPAVPAGHPVYTVDFGSSCALLVPATTVRSIGMMDADLFMHDIDTDWCLQGRARGLSSVVVAAAAAYHDSTPKNKSPQHVYLGIRNRLVVFRRHRILPAGAGGTGAVAATLLSDLWHKQLWGKGELSITCAFAYVLGVFHFLIGRMGPAPRFLQKPNAGFVEGRFRLWLQRTRLWKAAKRAKQGLFQT